MYYPHTDLAFGLDPRAVRAMARLGVRIGTIQGTDKPLRWQITFTFSCDRELAKYHVSTFLADEYNATNVQFFASVKNPRNCYCQFTPRGS